MMCCNDKGFTTAKIFKVVKVWIILVHTSLRVVGDCLAAKPSARTRNNGGGGLSRGGNFLQEHQQVHELITYIIHFLINL